MGLPALSNHPPQYVLNGSQSPSEGRRPERTCLSTWWPLERQKCRREDPRRRARLPGRSRGWTVKSDGGGRERGETAKHSAGQTGPHLSPVSPRPPQARRAVSPRVCRTPAPSQPHRPGCESRTMMWAQTYSAPGEGQRPRCKCPRVLVSQGPGAPPCSSWHTRGSSEGAATGPWGA